MSVRGLNFVINLYSGLKGDLIFSIDYDDFIHNSSASDYFYSKVYEMINNEEDCNIKIGYKN